MQIDYIEFASPELAKTQSFFARAFGWGFVDYGPQYREITGAGLSAGVEAATLRPPLIILKTDDLQAALDKVTQAGAEITQPIFDFPGGRRFHFREPGGTEMAVWSDKA